MTISKEARIGILATLSIAAAIWGYKFLKGENILDRSIILYAEYEDAKQINKSAPIYFRGVDIGSVKEIFFKPEGGLAKATLLLNLRQNPGIPKNARAVLFANGLLGGTAVNIEFDKACNGGDCVENEGTIQGVTKSAIESMLGEPQELDPYFDKAGKGVKTLLDTVSMYLSQPDNEVHKSLVDVKITLQHLRATTAALNKMMNASAGSIDATMQNMVSITGNLKANNEKISTLLNNVNDITANAKTMDFSKINKATEGVGESVDELKKTMAETQNTLKELTSVMVKMKNGEGTVGQFVTNDSVYHSLNMTLMHTQALMQDLRLNPKRYISLNPFRKYKTYVVPSEDPLLDTLQKRYNMMKN
jgi:phospholipid/cholesterol/gamma-HCH transport system substrate-binding protein